MHPCSVFTTRTQHPTDPEYSKDSRRCSVHGIEVQPHEYVCAIGHLASQVETELHRLQDQIDTLTAQLEKIGTERMQTLAKHLEELHGTEPHPPV